MRLPSGTGDGISGMARGRHWHARQTPSITTGRCRSAEKAAGSATSFVVISSRRSSRNSSTSPHTEHRRCSCLRNIARAGSKPVEALAEIALHHEPRSTSSPMVRYTVASPALCLLLHLRGDVLELVTGR